MSERNVWRWRRPVCLLDGRFEPELGRRTEPGPAPAMIASAFDAIFRPDVASVILSVSVQGRLAKYK